VRRLLGSRWFLTGLVIASVAGVLHIAALALAPISVVEAVMDGGVVILAVLAERVVGWRVSARQWSGVILGAVGLSLLAFTLPEIRGAHTHFSPITIVTFELVLLAATALLLLSPRLRRLAQHDGALIGAASGVLLGISDIAFKALLVAAGVIAQYVSARSLQTGDAVSVTAMTGLAVNIANIAGGIVIFGDPIAHGLPGTIAQTAALALICAAALLTPAPVSTPQKPTPIAAT
jgi:hypothetical protein